MSDSSEKDPTNVVVVESYDTLRDEIAARQTFRDQYPDETNSEWRITKVLASLEALTQLVATSPDVLSQTTAIFLDTDLTKLYPVAAREVIAAIKEAYPAILIIGAIGRQVHFNDVNLAGSASKVQLYGNLHELPVTVGQFKTQQPIS